MRALPGAPTHRPTSDVSNETLKQWAAEPPQTRQAFNQEAPRVKLPLTKESKWEAGINR